MTDHPGHATELTRRAIEEGAESIVVVGGDGTLGNVVDGLSDPATGKLADELPSLVYLPSGTGGDFARSLGLKQTTPKQALTQCTSRRIDVGQVELIGSGGQPSFRNFINIASFGVSGLTVEMVNKTTKVLGARASFSIGSLRALWAWRDRKVRLRVDDTFDSELTINTVAMANGRYFGGGMKIAPAAILDDGLLDIIVVRDIKISGFVRHIGKLYRGEHLDLPHFISLQGRQVRVDPLETTPVPIETDGENPGCLPLKCSVLPRAVEVIAPWHRAEAIQTDQ